MGVLVLTFGAGLVPLVMTVYKGRRDPKRVVGLILACGMLLSVLTPPLPYAVSPSLFLLTIEVADQSPGCFVIDQLQ